MDGQYWDYREARWVPAPPPVPEPRTAVESEDEADVRSG